MFRAIYLLLFVMIASSCNRPTPPPYNVLRISFSSYPTTLDPRKTNDFTSAAIISLLYEGLTKCLPDGTQELALAENIEVSSDQKTYIFHLRKTYWSDGKPVTATDFERSWKQSLNPVSPSLSAYLFYPIVNAEAACKGTRSLDDVGIRSINESTLEVQLIRPTSYFISLTSFPSFSPIPHHRLSEKGFSISSIYPIGNGPFLIEKTMDQSSIILRKNSVYWNAESIQLEGIHISILPNETVAFQMFEQGKLDLLGGHLAPIPLDAVASMEEKLSFFPMAASTFCTFNLEKLPLSNKKLRLALSLAIDRDEIANEVLFTHQIPATRCIPPSLDRNRNREIFPAFNTILAKKYFLEAIEEIGEPVPEITLHYRFGTIERRIAQVLQERWNEILGVKIILRQNDFKTHKDLLHHRNYEIALANWIAQYQDPINILERFKSKSNAKNYPSWENSTFSLLLDRAQGETDLQVRSELIDQAEDILVESASIVLLYHWNSPSIFHPRVQNILSTPSGSILLERCVLTEENRR